MNALDALVGIWQPLYMVLPQQHFSTSLSEPTPSSERCQQLRNEPLHQQKLPRPLKARFELEFFADGRYVERFFGSDHLAAVTQECFESIEQEYGYPEEREPLEGTWTWDEENSGVILSGSPEQEPVKRFHEGGFRSAELHFDWFSLRRHANHCDFVSSPHLSLYVRKPGTEPFAEFEQSELVQSLRFLLSQEPTTSVWEAICWHVQCWEGSGFVDFAVEYVRSHTSHWSAEDCFLPWFWFRRMLDGESFPGLRLIRSMERHSLREFELDLLMGWHELENLEKLTLIGASLHPFDFEELLQAPIFRTAQHLHLERFGTLSDDAAYTLARATQLSHLETLEMANFWFSDEAWDAIEQAPHFANTTLTLTREVETDDEYDEDGEFSESLHEDELDDDWDSQPF